MFFFKTGPFAWNGLVSFWLLMIVGFGWFLVVTIVVARAVRQQEDGPDPQPSALELVSRIAALERALVDSNGSNPRTKETVK